MKRILFLIVAAAVTGGCGGSQTEKNDPEHAWVSSPTKVVEGIMYAYKTRNDSLYASLLSDDFRYYFEPAGADSADILGWGKEEEVVATGNLFRTPDVDSLSYELRYGEPHSIERAGGDPWMVVPISGGEMIVLVDSKEPMEVQLNRQEIVVRKVGDRWEIVEWHDYPEGEGAGSED